MPARTRLRRAGSLARPSWRAFSAALQSRSNGVRNNSGQGAAAPSTLPTNYGTGGGVGLTTGVVGTGAENGVDYVDIRWSGTAGSTFVALFFDTITGIAAVNAQAWTLSAFLSRVGGTFTNVTLLQLGARQYDGASGFLADVVSSDLLASVTTTPRRLSATLTTNNASTAFLRPFVVLNYTNATAIDFTLRIGWPQFHLGSSALSPIRTSAAARTGVHSSTAARV